MNDLHRAGEICELCSEQGGKPRVLVELPETTQRYREEVAVCPRCDGSTYDTARKNLVPKKKR